MDPLAAQFQNLNINFIPSSNPDDRDQLRTDTSRVYLRYDVANPPPHPGKGWTRFVCVSDTHGWTPNVPSGDVFIHAGDLTVYGRRKSFDTTIRYLKSLSHPVKLVIAGNHDRLLDPELYPNEIDDFSLMEYARNSLAGPEAYQAGVRYLHFQPATVKKGLWKVYGSPATPWYHAGAFQYFEGDAAAVNSIIPRNTQILITHGPPHGVLDGARRGKSAGCPALAARLFAPQSPPSRNKNKRKPSGAVPSPSLPPPYSCAPQSTATGAEYPIDTWLPDVRLHVFGHIHEAWGAAIITREPPSISSITTPSIPTSTPRMQSTSSPPGTEPALLPGEDPGPTLKPVETVFVNAAVQQRGSGPVIVDLFDLN